MLFNILALISLLVMMMILRTLVEVFPSLMACLIRSKESINLEASVQLSRSRNVLAFCLIAPFCLLVWKRNLYTPEFLAGFDEDISIGITFGVFAAYALIRKMMEFIVKGKIRNNKVYEAACKSGLTFFSILTLTLLAMSGIMSILDTPADVMKSAMLWISACIYLIFILRKTQILISSASFFAAFLYLCALEIVPTGALIASAIIF
jgi:hypothetical protein